MKKILSIGLGVLLMGTVFAGIGPFKASEYANKADDILKRNAAGEITSTTSTDTLGSSTDRWDKIWADDLDATNATIGGISFGAVTIDIDDSEALLVRKDGDAGDIFTVDTVNAQVKILETGVFGVPANPTIAFGDGDTGFYEDVDDSMRIAVGGLLKWNISAGLMGSNSAGGGLLINSGASATVPSVTPNAGDTDIGLGSAAADQLSLIAGGIEGIRITESGSAISGINVNGPLQFKTGVVDPSHSEGLLFYDDTNKTLGFYNDETDTTLQVGQEVWGRFVNATGAQIDNGEIVYISGESGGLSSVLLANAGSASTAVGTIAIATHDVGIGAIGVFTKTGVVRNVSTTGFTAGDQLWLSTTDGQITNTMPTSPNYAVFIGNAGVIDGANGTIEVNINAGGNTGEVIKIFNGAILEDHQITISESAGTVSLQLEKSGGGDLSLFFNGLFRFFDSTPAASVNLTAGSDVSPTLNYVYILESNDTLTASTASFPAAQHVPVATVLVQSASSVNTDGAYKVHAWTDHLSNGGDMGHLSHLNKWIRNQNATWASGVAPTTSITTNGGAIDNVYFSSSSGVVLQLHDHSYPAMDMSVSDPAFVINDFTTAFDRITDLSAIDTDSLGNTLRGNNTYYNLVVWGVVSESNTDSKIIVNAPSCFYTNAQDVIDDNSGCSNFSIPPEFTGTGFLIANVKLRYQTLASGTITEVETESLLGLVPSTGAGGGIVGGGTEFSDNLFRIQNVSDTSKEIEFDAAGITTATTRTITMSDGNVDLSGASTDEVLTWNGTSWGAAAVGLIRALSLGRLATVVDANTTSTTTIVGVTDTSIARTITLDSDDAAIESRIIIIKDESGAALTNNITIDTEGAQTIDGVASIPISVNYGVLRVYSDGTNWFSF